MSRRCRPSLVREGGTLTGGDLSSGCDCGRLVGSVPPAPCLEIFSPSFISLDAHVALYGLGFWGYELPYHPSGKDYLQFSDGSRALLPGYGILNSTEDKYISGSPPPYQFYIDSDDPPAGHTYHIELYTGSGVINRTVRLVTGRQCVASGSSYTSTVENGSLIIVRYQQKVSSVSGTPWTQVAIDINTATGTGGSSYQPVDDATTSWEVYQHSYIVSNPLATSCRIGLAQGADSDMGFANQIYRLADMQVFITPPGGDLLVCAQANLITIDNSTTETDFL